MIEDILIVNAKQMHEISQNHSKEKEKNFQSRYIQNQIKDIMQDIYTLGMSGYTNHIVQINNTHFNILKEIVKPFEENGYKISINVYKKYDCSIIKFEW